MPDNIDSTFLFYLTLHSNKTFELPAPRKIVGDSVYATWNRSKISSSLGIGDSLMLTSTEPLVEADITGWHNLGVTYTTLPSNGEVMFRVEDIQVNVYGFYNDDAVVLAITNIADLDTYVQLTKPREWFVYRFKSMNQFETILYPSRLVAKWNKWASHDAAKRFAALEASMFRFNSYHYD